MSKQIDSQLIELAGRNWLMSQLIHGGIEVARPERDRGVDLIAYLDPPKFRAVPIQMKAFRMSGFSVNRNRYRGMLLVYVWYVGDSSKTVAFALTWADAQRVSRKMKWKTDGVSGKKGVWFVNAPAAEGKLARFLNEHRMSPRKWRAKIREMSASPDVGRR